MLDKDLNFLTDEYFNAFDRVLDRLVNYKPDFLIFTARGVKQEGS